MEAVNQVGVRTVEVSWSDPVQNLADACDDSAPTNKRISLSNLRVPSKQSQRLCTFSLVWYIKGFVFLQFQTVSVILEHTVKSASTSVGYLIEWSGTSARVEWNSPCPCPIWRDIRNPFTSSASDDNSKINLHLKLELNLSFKMRLWPSVDKYMWIPIWSEHPIQ